MSRQTTHHLSGYLESKVATTLFERLRDGIVWEEGVRSRSGPTRKAKAVDPSQLDEDVWDLIDRAILDCVQRGLIPQIVLTGIYLNYYRNGNDYTPNHSHPGSLQLILSLGATRTLRVGNRSFALKNGDLILFGGSQHGVPREPEVHEGRISIATFLQPLSTMIWTIEEV